MAHPLVVAGVAAHSDFTADPLRRLRGTLDAFLTVVDGIQKWSTHANGCGSEAHALEDVGAATHAAVDEDFELREDCRAVELAF